MFRDVPNFHYFRSKNPFSGSIGEFRYRLEPGGEELRAFAWFGPNCMDATDPELIQENHFSMDDDGLAAALEWLTERVNERGK